MLDNLHSGANSFLMGEALALLTRLDRLKAFSLQTPMVPAAGIAPQALRTIEQFLKEGQSELRGQVKNYILWLQRCRSGNFNPCSAQHKMAMIRLKFNNILSQVDIFADVLNQRSENETGVWMSALDAAAQDALDIPGNYFSVPPVICYLDRGHGAAIRRARTRLPGGGNNPVAVIRIPRERMIGCGIASSLFHEVGHQGSVLLGLVKSVRPFLASKKIRSGGAWVFWDRWISEIIADFWSLSMLGITATVGLMGVVSLPRAFVFRMNLDDPHPFPWIRVKISCAMGNMLYPHPQWERLSHMWDCLYPPDKVSAAKKEILSVLMEGMPPFISLLANNRPPALKGRSLLEVFALPDRTIEMLRSCHNILAASPGSIHEARPSFVFAALGQAKVDGKITPEREGALLSGLFQRWALEGAGNAYSNRYISERPKALQLHN